MTTKNIETAIPEQAKKPKGAPRIYRDRKPTLFAGWPPRLSASLGPVSLAFLKGMASDARRAKALIRLYELESLSAAQKADLKAQATRELRAEYKEALS